jgi:hypothetical protein
MTGGVPHSPLPPSAGPDYTFSNFLTSREASSVPGGGPGTEDAREADAPLLDDPGDEVEKNRKSGRDCSLAGKQLISDHMRRILL